ncbi:MAG: hypothetical protein HFG58_13590 [Lachnospiraceae bacterium]|nr:hypothetical protein [Lachnospiraceae bacterium]
MKKRRWLTAGITAAALLTAGYGPHEMVQEPEKSVVISLAGDCSLGNLSIHGYEGTFREMYDRHGPGYFFQNVKSVFEADDMTLVNFEGVLTNSNHLVKRHLTSRGSRNISRFFRKRGLRQ